MKECPGISCLFSSTRPSAIARFVIAIIVDAVNGKSGRSMTHICEKGLEAITPTVAHLDASATVVCIVPRVWVAASLNHAGPSTIFRCLPAMPRVSMRQRAATLRRMIAPVAAAALQFVSPKIGRCGSHGGPALAFAAPHGSSVASFGEQFRYEKPSKSLPDKIAKFGLFYKRGIAMSHHAMIVRLAKSACCGWARAVGNATHDMGLYHYLEAA